MKEELTCGLVIKTGVDISDNATMQMAHTIRVMPKDGKHFSLEELQRAVGGYIELVRLPYNNLMFVDEEGQLKGKRLNVMATRLARQTIVGDVIICGASLVD